MSRRDPNILSDERVGRLLTKLSIPAFLGMFVMSMYNIVDTIFLGHYVGPLGIAALSIVFPFQMLSMGMGHLTGMGGASVISRLIGSGNTERAERALGNSISSTLILSIIIMTIGLVNVDFWVRVLGSSETILPYARDYFSIILIGTALRTFSMSLSVLIRSEGNARVAMVGMITGAVTNVALDAIFIIVMDMGVSGAALATVIGQALSTTYFLSYYLRHKSFLKIHLKNLILEWDILKDIFTIGVSSFARSLASSISAIIVNRAMVAYGGDYAISAWGILNRIQMFANMPNMIIGQGLQPILGYNFGAKRYGLGLKAIKLALIASTLSGFVVFFVLVFTPQPLIRIFSNDTELVNTATDVARKIFMVFPLLGIVFPGSMVFQAIGKAKEAFATAITTRALFLIPLVYVLPHFMDINGVWFAFPISDILSFILSISLLIPLLIQFRKAAESQKIQALQKESG